MNIGTKIGAVFAVGLAIILAVGTHAYISTQRLLEANRWVAHTHEVIENLEHVLSVLKDAETSQRGFVLTGEERYLEPYASADVQFHRDIDAIAALTADNPTQQSSVKRVHDLADAKMAELAETISLRRKSGLEGALPVILTDRGKKIMDDLRDAVGQMKDRERQLLEVRNNEANASAGRTIWTIAVWTPLCLLVLAIAAVILMRTVRLGGSIALPGTPREKWAGIIGRYVSAVVVVAAAALLQSQLERVVGKLPVFIVFYPAVLLVASIGGGGPGIVTTALSAMAADYWFIPPYGGFTVDRPNDVLALGIFIGANMFLCILAERLRRSRWAEAVTVAQERQLDELSQLNEELSRQSEELAQQSEELVQQNEELSQQSEELSQQSEELAEQNEELQSQSDEIHTLNAELQYREEVMQKLLDSARLGTGEAAAMRDICDAAQAMFGPLASAVAVYERQDGRLIMRAGVGAGLPSDIANVEARPQEHSFSGLVMDENKTACLADAALRPDLSLLQIPGEQPFRAVLASPMSANGKPFGVVAVYSRQKQAWNAVQFRLAEWLAAQCAHILQTLRLQDQMARQAALIDLSPDGIMVRKLDGTITFWSHGAETLYGWTKEEALGQQTHAMFQTRFPKSLEQVVEEMKRTGRWSGDLTHRTKDGRDVVVQSWWMAQLDAHGEVTEIFESNADITERKRAEEALWSVAQFPDENPYPVMRIDGSGTVLYANKSSAVLGSRWPCEVGHTVSEPLLHRVRESLDNGQPSQMDLECEGRVFSFVLAPVGSTGYVNLYGRDITERKRADEALRASEEQFRHSIEDAPIPVIMQAENGEVLQISRTWTDLTGYVIADFATGDGWLQLAYGEGGVNIRNQMCELLSGDRQSVDAEFEILTRSGESRYWSFSASSPGTLQDGRRFVVGMAVDITDRKRGEEALRDTADDLARSNSDLEQFAYVASHDLQEPLRIVNGFVQLLQHQYAGKLDAKADEYINYAVDASKRMQTLIGDLLSYSRVGTRGQNLTPTDVGAALRQALENLGATIQETFAQVTHGELPTVLADGGQMTQLFQNLIGNAIKFHGAVAPKIHIEARRNESHWHFSVRDNGIGIDAEFRDRIFLIFQRLHTRQQYPGTGIGLAICKKIVERHGGRIWVESQGGQGATFFFTLPS